MRFAVFVDNVATQPGAGSAAEGERIARRYIERHATERRSVDTGRYDGGLSSRLFPAPGRPVVLVCRQDGAKWVPVKRVTFSGYEYRGGYATGVRCKVEKIGPPAPKSPPRERCPWIGSGTYSLTLSPLAGRDYRNRAEVIADWQAEKLFTIETWGPDCGRTANRRDLERDHQRVAVRYKQLRAVVVLNVSDIGNGAGNVQ
jgi:hypothetical protein